MHLRCSADIVSAFPYHFIYSLVTAHHGTQIHTSTCHSRNNHPLYFYQSRLDLSCFMNRLPQISE